MRWYDVAGAALCLLIYFTLGLPVAVIVGVGLVIALEKLT